MRKAVARAVVPRNVHDMVWVNDLIDEQLAYSANVFCTTELTVLSDLV